MAKRNQIIDRDRGAKKRVRDLKGSGSHVVKVGIIGTEAARQHRKGRMPMVRIASFHEFGDGANPERSFIRSTFDSTGVEMRAVVRRLARLVGTGKMTEKQALGIVGAHFVGKVQKSIADRIPPPLSQATIDRKGSDVPLIDTGQLRSSITWKVARK